MRPLPLPGTADSAPCFSGRTATSDVAWRGRPARHAVSCSAQQQQQGQGQPVAQAARASARAQGSPTRLEAFASVLGEVTDVATDEEVLAGPRRQARAPVFDFDLEKPAAGRKKPLKINLDLALYRARQTRIGANRSRDAAERRRLVREAESALRRCLEMDPEDGRPYVMLGKLLLEQRRYEEAGALYERGCAATGGTNAHLWTAWAYLVSQQERNAPLARRLYDAAIVAAPGHAAAWHGWGLLEKREGNYGKARELWMRGVEATRGAPNPYLFQSLAVLAAELEAVEEARRWFRQGTKTLAGSASHALWQAWARMEQRHNDDPAVVRMLYARGLEASPRSRYTFLSWALWEKAQGDMAAARKLLRQGAALNPRDAALFQAWAILEEECGDVNEARRLFRKGSRADPAHLYIWQGWGCMEFRQGRLDAARELFQQGVWSAAPRAKGVSLIFQAWAVLERSAGSVALARELFKCAVKADPTSEPSWLAWAAMEEELGALQRANELRNFSMQERQEVVRPASYSGLPGREGLLAPIFKQITRWFQRYEAAGSPEGRAGAARGAVEEYKKDEALF